MENNESEIHNLISKCSIKCKIHMIRQILDIGKYSKIKKPKNKIRIDYGEKFSKTFKKDIISRAAKGDISILDIIDAGRFQFVYKLKEYFTVFELLATSIASDTESIKKLIDNCETVVENTDCDLQHVFHFLMDESLSDPTMYLEIFKSKISNICDFEGFRPIDIFILYGIYKNDDDTISQKELGLNLIAHFLFDNTLCKKKLLVKSFHYTEDERSKFNIYRILELLYHRNNEELAELSSFIKDSYIMEIRNYFQK